MDGCKIRRIADGFFTGINYWASKNATRMWDEYDPGSVEADFVKLRDAGITHLRVFPLWPSFQPLTALYTPASPVEPYEYRFGEEPLPDTEAGRAGVSEEACRHFESFCSLAQKYGMKLIVGLITGHMSFRNFMPPAFVNLPLIGNSTVLKWQLRFVRYFVRRFRDQDCIAAWDLGNEVNNLAVAGVTTEADFYTWCSAVADTIRANDETRPVVSGMDSSSPERGMVNLRMIGEVCDVHTCHPYNIFSTKADPLPTMKPILDPVFKCRMYEDLSKVPTFVQEFGAIGYLNCSEKTEASFYRGAAWAALTHGCHGVMWWCAFDQGQHRFAPYDWNNIGSDYGFFDRNGRAKPISAENVRFKTLLAKLPGGKLPPHRTDGVILVPRDNGDADADKLRAAFLLGKQANLDFRFSYAPDPIPDAPLYVLPSLDSNQSIPARRIDELLTKVREGAVLYISLGNALFRDIPAVTGVEMAFRACVPEEKKLCLDGAELPVLCPVRYEVEKTDAEVLGRDAQGKPMFFAKRLGKGMVFFLTAPLENNAGTKPGVFWGDGQAAYSLVYRRLADAAGIRRIADSDSSWIRLTEHPTDENCAYIAAVNYTPEAQTAHLSLRDGKLETLEGKPYDHDAVTLQANDGVILIWRR